MRKEGDKAEEWSRRYLEQRGFVIVSNNFSVRGGEIDIIARSAEGVFVFFEVKMRRQMPVEHLSVLPYRKITRLLRAARGFLATRGDIRRWRIDLLLLVPNEITRLMRVVWYRNVSLTRW